ncbi:MAG: hypothetical protein JWO36_3356 [Myxococcales bacterium]|nr:hypothetical protein [Myxococcales bacterium]
MAKRVRITRWCSVNDSRDCLDLVLSDAAEIAEALGAAAANRTWTTGYLIEPLAVKFQGCIVDCGGAAVIVA